MKNTSASCDRLRLTDRDNVAVCLTAQGDIPAGHKVALADIPAGAPVIKYGQIIGRATCDIPAGAWVHTHNLRSHLDENPVYTYHFAAQESPATPGMTFRGYRRPHGRAGIRNEIYIIPTVGCVNSVCRQLERRAQSLLRGNLDGIYALTHTYGCSQLGADHENFRRLLAAIACNPNAAFVLFVGLGCENNGIAGIRALLPAEEHENVAFFNCQEVGDEIAFGMDILADFAARAARMEREDVPLSELAVGLKCGGSDAFSGITANPLVGKVADRLVAAGASAVLTEVPEMFGAEQGLMNRCATKEIYDKLCRMIGDFRRYYTDQGFPVYENPSPGNKAGGITTLEEKSLGCVEKAGHTPIRDVLGYAGLVKQPGISLLNAPGNDLIAATALAAAGCQMVLFTTGRGTPFSTFVPTVKIASNDRIATLKSRWIDFDAAPMDEDALFSLVLSVASGETRVRAEDAREIAFYKTGVTL